MDQHQVATGSVVKMAYPGYAEILRFSIKSLFFQEIFRILSIFFEIFNRQIKILRFSK